MSSAMTDRSDDPTEGINGREETEDTPLRADELAYLDEIQEIVKLMPTREQFIEMARNSPPPQEWFDEGEEVEH